MDKKQSSDWYIAATHYLTGVFIPNIIGKFVLVIVFGFANALLGIGGDLIANIEIIAGTLVIVWFGSMYGARYINSHYFIKDAAAIAGIATVFCLIINVLLFSVILMVQGQTPVIDMVISIVSGLAISAVFYLGSKKFIKNSAPAV